MKVPCKIRGSSYVKKVERENLSMTTQNFLSVLEFGTHNQIAPKNGFIRHLFFSMEMGCFFEL